MNKIVLIILVVVAFGNIFAGQWDNVEYEVAQITLVPPNSTLVTTGEGAIFFSHKEDAPSSSDWFVYHITTNSDLTGSQKAILAVLMNAQTNGKKVRMDISGQTLTIEGVPYRSFTGLKLVN